MADNPRRRIPGYLAALGVYGAGSLVTAVAARAAGVQPPARYPVADLALGAVAVHKFARIVTKDAVTTPLRAPFTEFDGPAGSGEVNDKPLEDHPAHTVAELLTCPFCMAPWLATAYVAGLSVAPRAARTWAAVFSVVAGSDALQHVYARLRTD